MISRLPSTLMCGLLISGCVSVRHENAALRMAHPVEDARLSAMAAKASSPSLHGDILNMPSPKDLAGARAASSRGLTDALSHP